MLISSESKVQAKRFWLIGCAISLLSACSHPVYEWRKDGASAADLDTDFKTCRQMAMNLPSAGDAQLSDHYLQCMVRRGWHQHQTN